VDSTKGWPRSPPQRCRPKIVGGAAYPRPVARSQHQPSSSSSSSSWYHHHHHHRHHPHHHHHHPRALFWKPIRAGAPYVARPHTPALTGAAGGQTGRTRRVGQEGRQASRVVSQLASGTVWVSNGVLEKSAVTSLNELSWKRCGGLLETRQHGRRAQLQKVDQAQQQGVGREVATSGAD
jgi:hypothetical protein